MSSVSVAIAQQSGSALRKALKLVLGDALLDNGGSSAEVVGIVVPLTSSGEDWPSQAAEILEKQPSCCGLVVAHPIHENLRDGLRSALGDAFTQGIHPVSMRGNLLKCLLEAVERLKKRKCPSFLRNRLREIIFAKELWQRIIAFSHGGRRDITNQVLAPSRFLKGPFEDAASDLLRDFAKLVSETKIYWWLTQAMIEQLEILCADDAIREETNVMMAAETLMDLLTECRALAGAQSSASSTTPPAVNSLDATRLGQDWPYQILVIDDHAQSWRPVFEQVQRKLSDHAEYPLPVKFTFRTGGEDDLAQAKVQETKEAAQRMTTAVVTRQISDHDAVLLDIYLPPPLYGIELLKELRRHSVNVPVIVWTSSRAPELPAEAQLAHGFLFKKTSTLDTMTQMIRSRLLEGNAKRRYLLPGHFFDHSLRQRANRKTALRMVEYCSKQMDSFHALDDSYFRTFTDHGGRHLFKLVEYLGDVLRHLSAVPDFFSQNEAEREEEILALYLAVFLHEFGMLRLRGPHEPRWDRLVRRAAKPNFACSGRKLERELALVRALHAVRGMVLLAKKPPEDATKETGWHWPDEEGCHQARKRIWEGEERTHYLHAAVALITGHHSRLLPLSRSDKRGWNHDFRETYLKKARAALKLSDERLNRHLDRRFYSPSKVDQTLAELLGKIDNGRIERVRKHCAVFRFVDAIDVDQSRNPAQFLCRIGALSRTDRRETLKRQVIRHVRIEGGQVSMETNVRAPALDLVKEVWALKEKEAGDLNAFNAMKRWISDPWGEVSKIDDIDGPEKCHKAIDDWLEDFWDKPKRATASFLDFSDPARSRVSKIHIASLTALSVAGEILSEYRAIFECGLQGSVTLGKFWRDKSDPPGWASHQEKMLSILFHPEDGLDGLLR